MASVPYRPLSLRPDLLSEAFEGARLPILFRIGPDRGRRFLEFFTVNIRNRNTRRAYFKAVQAFAAWCEEKGLGDLSGVTPMHVAAYVEQFGRTHSKPTVKQHLGVVRPNRRKFRHARSSPAITTSRSIGFPSPRKV
jgi:hypothetical protein